MHNNQNQVFTIVESALGVKILKIEELDPGNDSRVFKLYLEYGSKVILKSSRATNLTSHLTDK
jgi:hypothetical protein